MKVGLIDVDSKIPNLALMKISAYHKAKGDEVKFYDPMFDKPDLVYASKIFTFTPDFEYWPDCKVIRGGAAYSNEIKLPEEIEHMCPDYDLYGIDYSMGFLTRGCIRKCSWCSVHQREGVIKPHQDIEQFLRHDKAILLDNNVLACDWGIQQIEKIAKLGVKIDFNQGLDARLIDDSVAKLLAKVKWLAPVRLACDTADMMPVIQKAVTLLRWHNVSPTKYSCYVLITKDIQDAVERIKFLKGIGVDPYAQAFISDTETPNDIQLDLERFCNMKAAFRSTTWDEYKKRAG